MIIKPIVFKLAIVVSKVVRKNINLLKLRKYIMSVNVRWLPYWLMKLYCIVVMTYTELIKYWNHCNLLANDIFKLHLIMMRKESTWKKLFNNNYKIQKISLLMLRGDILREISPDIGMKESLVLILKS